MFVRDLSQFYEAFSQETTSIAGQKCQGRCFYVCKACVYAVQSKDLKSRAKIVDVTISRDLYRATFIDQSHWRT